MHPHLYALRRRVFFSPDGGTGGGGSETPPVNKDPEDPVGETFSKDYVRELRQENKGWRLKASEYEGRAKAAEEGARKAGEEAEKRVSVAQRAADERIIRAELKAAAIKAGMIDLDGLKLADLSSVKLNEKGDVEGAEALMESLKKDKAWLFGAAKTSQTEPPPPPAPKDGKRAVDMDDAEYEKAKRKLIGR